MRQKGCLTRYRYIARHARHVRHALCKHGDPGNGPLCRLRRQVERSCDTEGRGSPALKAEIAYIDINPAKVQEVRVTRSPNSLFK